MRTIRPGITESPLPSTFSNRNQSDSLDRNTPPLSLARYLLFQIIVVTEYLVLALDGDDVQRRDFRADTQ